MDERNCALESCSRQFFPKSSAKQRFCGTSCSAKWRMAQPEVRAKVHSKSVFEKIASGVRQSFVNNPGLAVASSDRMRLHNPMADSSTREKMTSTLRLKGHRPSVRKGNGHEPTEAEQKLLSALGTSAIYNLPVPTLQPRTSNYPPVYKVDVAVPSLKLAIEADGGSHRQLSRKAEDAKKDALLVSLGWLVLRFSNRQILEDWPTVEATISQCLDLL